MGFVSRGRLIFHVFPAAFSITHGVPPRNTAKCSPAFILVGSRRRGFCRNPAKRFKRLLECDGRGLDDDEVRCQGFHETSRRRPRL